MTPTQSQVNALDLEMQWIKDLISFRLDELISENEEGLKFPDTPLLPESNYTEFLTAERSGLPERIMLALTLARAICPETFLDLIHNYGIMENQVYFGGYFDKEAHTFYPTVRTALFLASGTNQQKRKELLLQLHLKHWLFLKNILYAESPSREPASLKDSDFSNYQLRISPAYLRYFLGGAEPRLDEDPGFPAILSTSSKKYEDVVLSPKVREQLDDVIRYVKHKPRAIELTGDTEKWRSYVVIFSGFPGTGKTLTATTIGNIWSMPVYIVNQAQLVSKYVGETQKHLEKLFDRFDSHDCILFFDEADAIFGKRVDVKSSNDHHVNQDVTYLLQRVAKFNGLIILATNVHDVEGTFDKAFQRRFKRHIHFCFPDYPERLLLWEKSLPRPFVYADGLMDDLAMHYQINGSSIENILSDVIIEAIDRNTQTITYELIERFLKLDYKRRKMTFERHTDEEIFEKPVLRYGQGMPASTREFEGIEEKLKMSRRLKTAM